MSMFKYAVGQREVSIDFSVLSSVSFDDFVLIAQNINCDNEDELFARAIKEIKDNMYRDIQEAISVFEDNKEVLLDEIFENRKEYREEKLKTDKGIKTKLGWHEAAKSSDNPYNFSWDSYANVGDEVDEGIYNYFLNVAPPALLKRGYMQMGDTYGRKLDPRTGELKTTYLTIKQVDEGYFYCGNCFFGEDTERNEAKIEYGENTK